MQSRAPPAMSQIPSHARPDRFRCHLAARCAREHRGAARTRPRAWDDGAACAQWACERRVDLRGKYEWSTMVLLWWGSVATSKFGEHSISNARRHLILK